ncbi:hypothetical protein EZV62_002932 [Acer yangbiense]|uniref:Glycosyltransferase n=1 Tax=Acer yangbiense TaxID=1000413 RepID=A0A5C7IYQ8_9ROSI|nr:hypothetical protein EZV62_002932 [Acer yangbiense]
MKTAELIFIPSPGIGHLVSTLEFAKLLIDRDDRISITVLVMKLPTTPHVDACTKSIAAASQSRIKLIDLPQVDPPPLEFIRRFPEYFITLFVESQVSNVRKVVSEIIVSHDDDDSVRVTGLVVDFFCVSMIDVASELSLNSYVYLTSNVGFLNFMLYLATEHMISNSTEFESSDSELLIPGFVNPVPVSVLPSCSFNSNGYTTLIKLARRFNEVNGIIVNTFSELEPFAFNLLSGGLNPPVFTVGPVVDVKGQANLDFDEAQSKKIMRWLDDQPESSVVFLCFGSKGSFSQPQVKEIAIGLELSEYNFLWCLRVSPPDNDVSNQSINDDIFPEGFLERIRGRGMICDWAPQVDVLAHKAVGGFVSHCGWNSILESLWYGVPIVTWPLYAEQQLNAFKMVKELGLAVEMRLDSRRDQSDLVMANEIAKAVRCVMDGDSETRRKVKEMAEISRKSLMDGGSSFISIRQFIDLNF